MGNIEKVYYPFNALSCWFCPGLLPLVTYGNHSNYFHCPICVETRDYVILTVTNQRRTRNLKYCDVLVLAHGT